MEPSAGTQPERRRRHAASAAGVAVTALVAAVVFWVSYDGGSYDVISRTTLAVAVWWAVGLGLVLGVWPRSRLRVEGLVAVGLLAAFVAWTALSATWAASTEKALLEAERGALHLGIYVLAAVAGTRASAARWADGLALGLVAVATLSVTTRLFPDLVTLSELERKADDIRLSYPVNYWNALAVLVALAVPLLLRVAVRSRNPLARAAALAPFPVIASLLYLTSSRGGFLAVVVGALVFLVASRRPWATAAALAVGGAGGAAAIALLHSTPALAGGGAPEEASPGVALLLALLCLGCGLAFGAATAAVPEGVRVPRTVSWVAVVAVALAAAGAVVAAEPRERFDRFKEPPPAFASDRPLASHLLSSSGSFRWQVWTAAVDQYREEPVYGQGAGSFEAWWFQHPDFAQVLRDAHSLYLETLGELGIVGLVLLAGALLAALAAAARRPLIRGDRTLRAALAGVGLAFAAAAAFDWFWEVPAVTAVALAALGLLARTDDPPADDPRPRASIAGVSAGAGALVVAAALGVALAGQAQLRRSQDEAAAGRTAAASKAAERARALAPWAASPRLQLALLAEREGALPAARLHIREATARDPDDWRLWLVTARIETKAGDVRSARVALARARELNPHSELLSER